MPRLSPSAAELVPQPQTRLWWRAGRRGGSLDSPRELLPAPPWVLKAPSPHFPRRGASQLVWSQLEKDRPGPTHTHEGASIRMRCWGSFRAQEAGAICSRTAGDRAAGGPTSHRSRGACSKACPVGRRCSLSSENRRCGLRCAGRRTRRNEEAARAQHTLLHGGSRAQVLGGGGPSPAGGLPLGRGRGNAEECGSPELRCKPLVAARKARTHAGPLCSSFEECLPCGERHVRKLAIPTV